MYLIIVLYIFGSLANKFADHCPTKYGWNTHAPYLSIPMICIMWTSGGLPGLY